jgi:site-specific recombinase XerD
MKSKIKSVKQYKKYDKAATIKVKEIKTLKNEEKINIVENKRDKAIMTILLGTGLRVSEFVSLNYEAVFTDIRKKQIKDIILITGKGNKERAIPLNDDVKKAILDIDLYNRKELELIGINRNTSLTNSQKKVRLGVRQIERLTKEYINLNPHSLRHTCFTNLINNGVNGETVQKLAGHTDYNTTVKYYISVSQDDLLNAVKTLEKSTNKEKIFRIM